MGDRCSVSCLPIGPKEKEMLKLHINTDGYNNEKDLNVRSWWSIILGTIFLILKLLLVVVAVVLHVLLLLLLLLLILLCSSSSNSSSSIYSSVEDILYWNWLSTLCFTKYFMQYFSGCAILLHPITPWSIQVTSEQAAFPHLTITMLTSIGWRSFTVDEQYVCVLWYYGLSWKVLSANALHSCNLHKLLTEGQYGNMEMTCPRPWPLPDCIMSWIGQHR